jgi:hypothetical protein
VNVSQNRPNPFRNSTEITVNIFKDADLQLTITNLIGQEVLYIEKSGLQKGEYIFAIDGSNWENGVYFYTLVTASQRVTKKMILHR